MLYIYARTRELGLNLKRKHEEVEMSTAEWQRGRNAGKGEYQG